MSDGFTVAAGSLEPSIFPCPKCGETIYSSAPACRFCGEKVDPEAAKHAALILAKVNQACSDASYIKSTALALPVFFIVRFLPFVSMLGLIGFVALSFLLPFWCLHWWIKYRGLTSKDAELVKARTIVKIAGSTVAAVFVVVVLGPFLFGLVPMLSH